MRLARLIPSIISMVRVLILPPVTWAILEGDRNRALALVALGGFSDFLDGFLARRYGWTSRTGAWLDAVADKILLAAVFVALAVAGVAPLWLVWLIFGRDVAILVMAGLGLAFTSIRDFPPSIWGKLSTNVQIATALALLAGVVPQMVWICAAATGFSGAHYLYSAVRRWRALA